MSKSSNREQILVIVAAILVFGIAIWALNDLFGAATRKTSDLLAKKIAENEKYETTIERALVSHKKLELLEPQTLPISDEIASSARYQNWLIELVNKSSIREAKISPETVKHVKIGKIPAYSIFPFSVKGRGSLRQIADFLERFYALERAQQITALVLKPRSDSNDVDVTITIEAMGLHQTPPSDTLSLPEKPKETIDLFKESVAAVDKRAMFSIYRPPAPNASDAPKPAPPQPPKFDVTPYCYLGAIVATEGRPQAWIDVRTEAKTLRLFEGDAFQLGDVRCIMNKINPFDVEVETSGMKTNLRFRIFLGSTFYEAENLGPVSELH